MSRKIVANESKDHVITLRGDQHKEDRLILVKGGTRAYLWCDAHMHANTVSGAAPLRALAYAILKEVGK